MDVARRTRTTEWKRLKASEERKKDWKNWGPYMSERAWGTVREDYSADGDAWNFFPYDHARSRAYRWNDDGLAGVCNRFQNWCLSIALWNEQDSMLKERLFGLAGPQGNHGEDVKELYWYLDSTPTHSYMKMLYKYPQVAYPYEELVRVNGERSKYEPEYEITDALKNEFEQGKYFDVFIEYAKADDNDILCKVTAHNRNATDTAPLQILPHLWLRNFWSWGYSTTDKPSLRRSRDEETDGIFVVGVNNHKHLNLHRMYVDLRVKGLSAPCEMLFTENNSNNQRLWGEMEKNESEVVKDGINDYVVDGIHDAVTFDQGTKSAACFRFDIPPGESRVVRFRFKVGVAEDPFGTEFDQVFKCRQSEADEFYEAIAGPLMSDDHKRVQRQAFAGIMWSKMFYHLGVDMWLNGDKTGPKPPESRKDLTARNVHWKHVYMLDVQSMPDKWEYPWAATWDLGFHCITIVQIDPEWAKRQLTLVTRDWFMHPNGALPAYEWDFGDVNPPVHAWATWRVFEISRLLTGNADFDFLEKVFQKLLLNFTWWVNRKDISGRNIFEGGFLGLDNIGVFDRSQGLPIGGRLEQADGTAWMAMYCLNMLRICLELALERHVYEDMCNKFFEHFLWIANAMNGEANGLWCTEDNFYYDHLVFSNGDKRPMRVKSFVGLIPTYAVEIIDRNHLEKLPQFKRRLEWLILYRPQLVKNVASLTEYGCSGRLLLSVLSRKRLEYVVQRIADPAQFLSDYGLRSLSKEHEDSPYEITIHNQNYRVEYWPGESRSGMFGGNSNWRGPIWFPVNYLMIESLLKFHSFYGDEFTFKQPGTGIVMSLKDLINKISSNLLRIFSEDNNGDRPFWGRDSDVFRSPLFRNHLLFHEFFHGDDGSGVGASHQTGWTSLIVQIPQLLTNKHIFLRK
eukprot:CFRG3782T1